MADAHDSEKHSETRGLWPNMKGLKLLAIVLPIAFLILVDVVRQTILSDKTYIFPGPFGIAFTYAVVAVSVVAFSNVIFAFITRLQNKVVDQNRQLAALNRIALLAAEEAELNDVINKSLDEVIRVMNVDAGLICLVDLERREHTAVGVRGFSQDLTNRIQRAKLDDDVVATEVVRTGEPVMYEKVFKDPKVAEAALRENVRAGISAPLKSEGEVNGILAIATHDQRTFSEDDIEFLMIIGGHLGLAIRKAVLFDHSQLQNKELSALLAVGKAVTSSFDLDEVVELSLDAVIEVTSADVAEVWLMDGDEEIALHIRRGVSRDAFLTRTRFQIGQGFPGVVARDLTRVLVHDLPSDSRFLRSDIVEAGFQTFCAIPMLSRGEFQGVLTVAGLSKDSLNTPWELRLLDAIAERVALAVENAHLHQRVQDAAVIQERERISREMHDGLGQVLGYINAKTLAVKKLVTDSRVSEAHQELSEMEEIARDLYADVREGILGLRTSSQGYGGLVAELRQYIELYGEMSGVEANLNVAGQSERFGLAPSVEIQLMRILQEALTNVRKHSNASAVNVDFRPNGSQLEVEVTDNGRGIDPDGPRAAGWPRFGLQTMRERAESVGGSFDISSEPGGGVKVVVSVPMGRNP
tara:strand:- start:1156 stop:3072 length:1917 start_codon:yes stop_codon:yes gene_type:complete